jgi:hypothetical protein
MGGRRATGRDERPTPEPTSDDPASVQRSMVRSATTGESASRPDWVVSPKRQETPSMPSRLRSLTRALTASALLATLLVGGAASTAFAAGSPADNGRYTFGDDYCWEGGSWKYCFEQDGSLTFVVTPDGTEMATIVFRQRTLSYFNGTLIGDSSEVSIDRSVWKDGGLSDFHIVEHTKAEFDGQTCVLTTVLKQTDYEIVLDHWNGPGCA